MNKQLYTFCRVCLVGILLGALAACASNSASTGKPGFEQTGIASFYADSLQGNTTANGEKFNQSALTAAHRKLPFGTRVRVTNVANGKTVTVRINDRGPFVRGRVIDLSKAAFKQIGDTRSGLLKVKLEIL